MWCVLMHRVVMCVRCGISLHHYMHNRMTCSVDIHLDNSLKRASGIYLFVIFWPFFFTYYNKIFHVNFPPHWTHHQQPLEVTSMESLKAKYAVAQNDWIMASIWGKIDILGLVSVIASAHPVSFIMRNTWAGVAIYRKWFNDEDFKAASVECGESSAAQSVSTARWMGLTT